MSRVIGTAETQKGFSFVTFIGNMHTTGKQKQKINENRATKAKLD
jgi:hypothetical protein